ncbi:uncharacterized protein C11orf24 homolog isoform X3 [Struthio camelus]|uniref:uncharacterized protein C11orf24 homolog isoform X3 n=1 Tax=Struthio camelus TaxID=8801 RepID=UPI00051E4FCC|nr:PREDICTED: uncharacterized protein C11orf24 homolog isoform X1 [Struthio camelus australis]XP_009666538.1 PREDICTED: uncharacterized protein C11orf24 homolog isoform X1 [Struthio camelus australis]XP_009666547.1 PREDICTED: uncharacterized protein C11orf24 homolog isoform X1 [Struthio camelus australis]XP_009666556.1 PREDICTED: uncharacterized protein C11orf24 homolog isoform X1 [Struthio camelus australis]
MSSVLAECIPARLGHARALLPPGKVYRIGSEDDIGKHPSVLQAPGNRSLPARPALKMWTAIVFLLLISFCACENRVSVLKERGAHIVRINRLTTEKQCRQACKGPAASGKWHCNWSVPYKNRCIFLQCRQLGVCQDAREQDIKDLLGEIVLRKRRTDLFHHQRYPEQMEKMVNAMTEQQNTENLLSSTAWTHKIHSRRLLGVVNDTETTHPGKTATNAATTPVTTSTAAAATTNGINTTVFAAASETGVKASNASEGTGDVLTKAMSSTASSPTSDNVTASVSNNVTKPMTTTEKSGNSSSGPISESPSPPLAVTSEAGTLPPSEQFNKAARTSPSSTVTTVGVVPKIPSTNTATTTLIPPDARTSSSAAARTAALTTSVRSHSSNPIPDVTSLNPEPEESTATTTLSKLATSAVVSTTAPTTQATTGHEIKSMSHIPSTKRMTTVPANAPGTTVSGLAGTQDTDHGYLLIAAEPLTQYLVDKSSLLAVLLFGTIFFITVIVLFLTQAYESYKKKDYTQVDYLINGMYVDSEM